MATSGGNPIHSTSPGVLKDLLIPENLVSTFLNLSKTNSDDGIETLGTFGGQICSDNKYRVTHLLIPKQTGHSDSCIMDGAEDIFKIHEEENIIFLGWIHTHPAYSVFLSSVDMHNQYERQRMLPEVSPSLTSSQIINYHLRT